MPGNKLRFANGSIEAAKLLFCSFGGWGVLPAELPTTGEHGPSFLLDDIDPGDDAVEVYPRITSVPADGVFTANEYGSFSLIGAAAGVYTFTYLPIADGVVLAEATETIVNGTEPMQFEAVLPAMAWDGSGVMSSFTEMSFEASLPSMEWSGGAVFNEPATASFSAFMPIMAWGGAADLGGVVPEPDLGSSLGGPQGGRSKRAVKREVERDAKRTKKRARLPEQSDEEFIIECISVLAAAGVI